MAENIEAASSSDFITAEKTKSDFSTEVSASESIKLVSSTESTTENLDTSTTDVTVNKTESTEGETQSAAVEAEDITEPAGDETGPAAESSVSAVGASSFIPGDSSGQKVDMIVFGATGFTGRHTVVSMMGIGNKYGIKWGVAGRNKDKLIEMLKEISNKTGTDITRVPKFQADVGDEKSLLELASHCRVLINCCGPFRFLGEPVVKACIAAGTHHIDVSGEPQYMEQMQLKYHKEAEAKKVYVVSACGFDSLVAEMGIIYLMNNFPGQLNSVETYLETEYTGQSRSGAGIHYGTWESAVYSLCHSDELRPLREQLYPKRLPNFKPKLTPRSLIHKSSIVNKWCLPFPGSDRSIALRTQRHFYDSEKRRPLQVQTYIAFNSFFKTIAVALVGIIFGFMVKTSVTRSLLLYFPKVFSFGMVSHAGPSDEARANTFFHMTFFGQGWSEKKNAEEDKDADPPNSNMTIKLSGQDPGYGFTCDALILSAFTVLKESSVMPGSGGVYPPGAAFAKTSLLKLLQDQGLKIEVISN